MNDIMEAINDIVNKENNSIPCSIDIPIKIKETDDNRNEIIIIEIISLFIVI